MVNRRLRHNRPVHGLGELSDESKDILDFERHSWQITGAKSASIKSVLRITPSVYYSKLRDLLDDARAYNYDPYTVVRLRRRRKDQRRHRIENPEAGHRR